MAWVRIHDGAMTHPKIVGLSDKAFRLWIWGLSYSQQHLTNGQIPILAIPVRVARAKEDLTKAGLWDASPSGYQVHDYLDWNDSRDVVQQKRTEAKERMNAARERRWATRDQQIDRANVRSDRLNVTSQEVLRRVGLGKESLEEKEKSVATNLIVTDEIAERAGRFVERYAELYTQKRKGAKYLRRQPALDWDRACQLCRTWEDARLEKMAVIFLTTDDEWISQTDRGFAVFVARASWADERLAAWEAQQKAR